MRRFSLLKRSAALFLAAAAAFVSIGCGKKETAASGDSAAFSPKLDASETATVNIVGSLENFESLEAVITDFEEYYPNCSVLYSCLTSSDYFELLKARLKSDSSTGIFIMSSEMFDSDYMKEICIDLLQEDVDISAIKPEVLEASKVDGKLFEIPLALTTSGLIVNTTLLEKQGLSVPQNYAEFLDACAKLKEAGYTPIQGDRWAAGQNLLRNMCCILLQESEDTDETLAAIEAGEEGSADALAPAFSVLGELTEKGYIDASVDRTYEDSYNGTILKFFEGDVPFVIGSTVTFSGTKKRETKSEHFSKEPFSYEFICAPIAEDGAYSYVENWVGFGVNKDCPEKEWAIEFMRFLYTKEEINKLASIKGLPSVAADSDDTRFAEIFSGDGQHVYTNRTFLPAVIEKALSWTDMEIIEEKTEASDACARFLEFVSDPNLMTE